MKNIVRYIAVLFCTLTTLTLQAYTLKVKGMPEETLQGMNVGSGVFNPWGDVGSIAMGHMVSRSRSGLLMALTKGMVIQFLMLFSTLPVWL